MIGGATGATAEVHYNHIFATLHYKYSFYNGLSHMYLFSKLDGSLFRDQMEISLNHNAT